MKKKIIIVLSILIIISIIIGIIIFAINKKDVKTVDNSEEIAEEKLGVRVDYTIDQTWQDGENNALKYSVKLINESEENKENWKIVFNVNKTTQISQGWNGKLELNESKLEITPESYNNIIPKDGQIDIGFILLDKEIESIKGYILYIDGKEYKGEEKIKEVEENKEIANVPQISEGTPVSIHGNLSVKGTNIVDKDGNTFIIQGVSTHGIAWFPQYVNEDTFKTLRDNFNVNTIRLAMYSDSSAGYNKDLHEIVSKGVEYASNLGMYVIIDWHVLPEGNPNKNKQNAIEFFEEMTNKYKDYNNIIYEICNEPNGNVTWEKDIKPYAKELISTIRNIDKDSIIIVGTPTWSQDVDIVSKSPIEDANNIVYALHYYAATHKQDLRNKLKTALNNNLPILVSEFGITDASGNGTVDKNEADIWIQTLRENGIGYVCWNLSNKNETSSLLKSTTTKLSDWTEDELSEEGKWLKETYNKN